MTNTDMMTLLAGDVDPPAKGARSAANAVSFQSVVAENDSETTKQGDTFVPPPGAEPEPVPEHFIGRLVFSVEGGALASSEVVPMDDASVLVGDNPETMPITETPRPISVPTNDAAYRADAATILGAQNRANIVSVEGDGEFVRPVSDILQASLNVAETSKKPLQLANPAQQIADPADKQMASGVGPAAARAGNAILANSHVPFASQTADQSDGGAPQIANGVGNAATAQATPWGTSIPKGLPSIPGESQAKFVDPALEKPLRQTSDTGGTQSQSTSGIAMPLRDMSNPQTAQRDQPMNAPSQDTATEKTAVADPKVLTQANPAQSQAAATEVVAHPPTTPAAQPTKSEQTAPQPIHQTKLVDASPTATAPLLPGPEQPAVLMPDQGVRTPFMGDANRFIEQPINAPKISGVKQNNATQNGAETIPLPAAQTPEIGQSIAASATAFPEVMPMEMQGVDSSTVLRHDSPLNRPEVMRHVAQQLTDAARRMPDRPIELALNPEELGRVRLTFTATENSISVAVVAERGETMELLRRHIETLAQEFRDLGYKDVNFDFSRSGAGHDQNESNGGSEGKNKSTNQKTPAADAIAPVQLSLDPSAGLDLRL